MSAGKRNVPPMLKHTPKFTSKDEEIMKCLHEQINQQTDYDQWKRSSKNSISTFAPAAAVEKQPSGSSSRSKERSRRYAEKVKTAQQEQLRERLKLLEMRLSTRRQSLEVYNNREKDLISGNKQLVEEIKARERDTCGNVNGYLMTYEKCRVGARNLAKLFDTQKTESNESLEQLKSSLGTKTADLEKWVREYDDIVKAQQKQIYDLQCYKDKEYHARSLQISDMEKAKDDLDTNNLLDYVELKQVLQQELEKCGDEQRHRRKSAYIQSSVKVLQMVPPSLKQMAIHNLNLRKEVACHETAQEVIQRRIQDLVMEMDLLKRRRPQNTRRYMFPEVISDKIKAAPDVEQLLDIPRQKWLPI